MSRDKYECYKERINEIISLSGRRNWKYLRNMREFTGSPQYALNNLTDAEVEGFYTDYGFRNESDTTAQFSDNMIRSCVETLKAMVSDYKVRPFINPYHGTYRDVRLAKNTQQWIDIESDELDLCGLVSNAFKDACVFDTGWLYLDKDEKTVTRALPWQVYVDPRQATYNKITEVVYRQSSYPYKDKKKTEYVTRLLYWNIETHEKVEYIQELDKFEVTEYTPDCIPFSFIPYSEPTKGMSNVSVADMLYGIQQEIKSINNRLRIAEEKSPIAYAAYPDETDIDISKVSNRVLQFIPYRSGGPGVPNNGIQFQTVEPYSQTFLQRLEDLKKSAREYVGLSEQSMQGTHTPGVDSGVAMGTLQNIEAQRFQVQANNVIRMYTDVIKKIIKIFDGSILPKSKNRTDLKWSELRRAVNDMDFQFAPTDILSKDPSKKWEILKDMSDRGQIPQSALLELMELPDLQKGYSISNNVHNAVMTVIEKCIEENKYEIPVFIPTEVLKSEIRSFCLSLFAINNPENDADIEKLLKLYDKVVEMESIRAEQQSNNDIANAQTQQINQQTAALDQQSVAMDGELANLQSTLQQLQSGNVDPAQAQQIIQQLQEQQGVQQNVMAQ